MGIHPEEGPREALRGRFTDKFFRMRREQMRYVCSVCGYVYDEEKEGIPFDQLSEAWRCPLCRAPKSAFRPEQEKKREKPAAAVDAAEEEHQLVELEPMQLAAIMSNLARGCEKQYKKEEQGLFEKLAGHFKDKAEPVQKASLEGLTELLREDLERGYSRLRAAAEECSDRGTLRICVWGEKVTTMLEALIWQYQQEGEAFLEGKKIWLCTVCGFIYVGDMPPEICPVCKVPSWKFDLIEGREPA